ncbi:uncharacterized protein N7503_000364 [Penicillium pulvis]|uniref:uncharacterized protein n=1 Tax=Penicillium pulvis TaxID=1562058 RepID=UPI002548A27B|nr:uncharacterized protein N7503_000364 [Penicillium pulvis]KAJ5813614.1 hypothetical protein N7503_000364 [Penicillium pulvis]
MDDNSSSCTRAHQSSRNASSIYSAPCPRTKRRTTSHSLKPSTKREHAPDTVESSIKCRKSSSRAGSSEILLGHIASHKGTPSPSSPATAVPVESVLCDKAPEPDSLPIHNPPETSRPLEEMAQAIVPSHENELDDFGSEPLPKAPIYDHGLQRGLRDVRKQLARLLNTMSLEVVSDQSSNLKELKDETEKLANFQYPNSRTVGFIGTSGEGKSSLINSLLDQPNIARASASGTACTSVVIEFCYVSNSHPQPYTLEAFFMNSEEIRELLEELLRSFRLYRCESSFNDIGSIDEKESLMDAADRAEGTLKSLFESQPDWGLDFLRDESEGAEKAILVKLEGWALAEVSRRPGSHDSLVYTVVSDNLKGCIEQLDYLAADSHTGGGPVFWPFTKLLRVYLKSPILRTGLVIADLPGFRDLNYARVRATNKYLSHSCDEIFIVSSIARCCSDRSIPDIKGRCADKPYHIVCTRSDAIYPEEEARGEGTYAEEIGLMNDELDELNDQLSEVRLSSRMNMEEAMRGFELMNQIEDLDFERKRIMITTRNDRVKRNLSQSYPETGVLCVSNSLYKTYCGGEQRLADAYIDLSGIRELREYCRLIPAAIQLSMTTAYLNHQIPAHLGSVRQWALAGADSVSTNEAPALRAVLSKVAASLRKGYVDPVQRNLNTLFDGDILQKINALTSAIGLSQDTWTSQCAKLCEDWYKWHHSTIGTFVRHNGDWKTRAVGYRCWNKELIAKPGAELIPHWQNIHQWLKSQSEILNKSICNSIQQVCTLLRQNLHHAPQSLGNLLSVMESRQQNISYVVQCHILEISRSTNATMRDMSDGYASSFMADLMRPAYLECTKTTGTGCTLKRKDIISNHVQTSQLFVQYHDRAKTDYAKVLKGHFDSLQKGIAAELEKIERDLNSVIGGEEGILEAHQKPSLNEQVILEIECVQAVLDRAQFDLVEATSRF